LYGHAVDKKSAQVAFRAMFSLSKPTFLSSLKPLNKTALVTLSAFLLPLQVIIGVLAKNNPPDPNRYKRVLHGFHAAWPSVPLMPKRGFMTMARLKISKITLPKYHPIE
jgi:hypothetical protein